MKKYIKPFHSVLGILFGIPLLLIGLSGALLSYESEILRLLNPKTYNIQSNNQKINDKTELLKNLEEKYDGAVFNVRFLGENMPMIVFLRANVIDRFDEKAVTRHNVYLNPYTDEILPPPTNGSDFFRFVRKLHIYLLLGDVGNEIVGLSTLYLVLLCVSGFILYYKFLRKNFKNAIKIDFKAKGSKFYYKLHSVFGVFLIPIFLIICISGLYWSYEWVRNGIFHIAGIEQMQGHGHGGHGHGGHGHGGHGHGHGSHEMSQNMPRFIHAHHLNLDDLTKSIEIFKQNYEYKEFRIVRHEETDAFRVIFTPKNARHSRVMNQIIIRPNGKIKEFNMYENQKIGMKIIRSMLMIHNGEFFGSIFKAIFCFASAFLVIFAWSGFVLWKNQKFKKIKNL